ncbi:MAG TPA: sigma-70 family RNA polymerase sigma factor [Caulobacteraceae bacterium]|nr:sigma-70 family RNA polymerase sigma factor [Caulobacteraceae bacterium]
MADPRTASAPASAHDLELVALAAAGGRAAFGELVRRHASPVRALLRRMGADASTADDVAQDAFLAAFEQIAEFRGEGTFQAWVKRIAARAYVKKQRRALRLELSVDPPDGEDDAVLSESDRAARIDLDEALKTLAPPERLCVSLCYGAGLSHGEVAQALNTPLGTVKSHVKRGLDKLRRRLAPGGGFGGVETTARG